jgi:hypothetical protein
MWGPEGPPAQPPSSALAWPIVESRRSAVAGLCPQSGKRGGLLGAVGRSGCRAGLANEVW